MVLCKLGFKKSTSKGWHSYITNTKARTEVSSDGDSTATFRDNDNSFKVHKPAKGLWTLNSKPLANQDQGTIKFTDIANFIEENKQTGKVKIDTTQRSGFIYK